MSGQDKNSLNWAMLCHLGGLATYVGIPLGNVVAPLIIWVFKKDASASVDAAGREAVNFNLSFTLYGLLAGLLCYVFIGFIALPIVLIAHVILVVQAALKANKGEDVRYPFTLRFIN